MKDDLEENISIILKLQSREYSLDHLKFLNAFVDVLYKNTEINQQAKSEAISTLLTLFNKYFLLFLLYYILRITLIQSMQRIIMKEL